MHKIAEKKFEYGDFSTDMLMVSGTEHIMKLIVHLNELREVYLNYDTWNNNGFKKPSKKDIWWQLIQLLPSSYNQTRNVMLNYEVLANIYKSRKDHKLDEWREFCKWIESLPYSELIIQKEQRGKQQLINSIDPDTATDTAVDYAVQMAKDAARHYNFEKEE